LDLRVPVTRIAEIVHQRRAITADTALRLGRYFKTTPVLWMNLQVRYDLEASVARTCFIGPRLFVPIASTRHRA